MNYVANLHSAPSAHFPGLMPSLQVMAIHANVVFGQSSNRCKGAGICRVDMYRGIRRPSAPENCRQALSCILPSERGLIFRFVKYSLCQTLTRQLFSQPYFKVNEAFTLEPMLGVALGRPEYRIPAGQYRIEKDLHHFQICFEW